MTQSAPNTFGSGLAAHLAQVGRFAQDEVTRLEKLVASLQSEDERLNGLLRHGLVNDTAQTLRQPSSHQVLDDSQIGNIWRSETRAHAIIRAALSRAKARQVI